MSCFWYASIVELKICIFFTLSNNFLSLSLSLSLSLFLSLCICYLNSNLSEPFTNSSERIFYLFKRSIYSSERIFYFEQFTYFPNVLYICSTDFLNRPTNLFLFDWIFHLFERFTNSSKRILLLFKGFTYYPERIFYCLERIHFLIHPIESFIFSNELLVRSNEQIFYFLSNS